MLILAAVLVAGCADSDVQEVKPSTDVSTDVSTEGAIANEEEAVQPEIGSYDNPAGINETIVISSSGNLYEVSVSEVIRGTEADYIVYQENEFNDKASPGEEYMLVKARVAYTQGSNSRYISSSNFKVFCEGVERLESWAVTRTATKNSRVVK